MSRWVGPVFRLSIGNAEHVKRAKQVVENFNSKHWDVKEGINMVELMEVGPWITFVGSYGLGAKDGYEAYNIARLTYDYKIYITCL